LDAQYDGILIECGRNDLSEIDPYTDAGDPLKPDFTVTVDGENYSINSIYSVPGIGFAWLCLELIGIDIKDDGTSYTVKVKYTPGSTKIKFDNGSELGGFETERTLPVLEETTPF
jgi:hypothetical protein